MLSGYRYLAIACLINTLMCPLKVGINELCRCIVWTHVFQINIKQGLQAWTLDFDDHFLAINLGQVHLHTQLTCDEKPRVCGPRNMAPISQQLHMPGPGWLQQWAAGQTFRIWWR